MSTHTHQNTTWADRVIRWRTLCAIALTLFAAAACAELPSGSSGDGLPSLIPDAASELGDTSDAGSDIGMSSMDSGRDEPLTDSEVLPISFDMNAEMPIAERWVFPVLADGRSPSTNIYDPRYGGWHTDGNPFGAYWPENPVCAGCGEFPDCESHPGEDYNRHDHREDSYPGEPVYAPADGVVAKISSDPAYGDAVLIRHRLADEEDMRPYFYNRSNCEADTPADECANTTTDSAYAESEFVVSMLMHIEADPSLRVGDVVHLGDEIGIIDPAFRHLHFEIFSDPFGNDASTARNGCGYWANPQAMTDAGYLDPTRFILGHVEAPFTETQAWLCPSAPDAGRIADFGHPTYDDTAGCIDATYGRGPAPALGPGDVFPLVRTRTSADHRFRITAYYEGAYAWEWTVPDVTHVDGLQEVWFWPEFRDPADGYWRLEHSLVFACEGEDCAGEVIAVQHFRVAGSCSEKSGEGCEIPTDECTSGECCDVATGSFLPEGTPCGTAQTFVDCDGSCGGDVVLTTERGYCSGSNDSCAAGYVTEESEVIASCDAGAICVAAVEGCARDVSCGPSPVYRAPEGSLVGVSTGAELYLIDESGSHRYVEDHPGIHGWFRLGWDLPGADGILACTEAGPNFGPDTENVFFLPFEHDGSLYAYFTGFGQSLAVAPLSGPQAEMTAWSWGRDLTPVSTDYYNFAPRMSEPPMLHPGTPFTYSGDYFVAGYAGRIFELAMSPSEIVAVGYVLSDFYPSPVAPGVLGDVVDSLDYEWFTTPCGDPPVEERSCYTGASATEGVGICRAGTQRREGGGPWGACEGQVLPGSELANCDNGQDDDCNGIIDDPAICDEPSCVDECAPGEVVCSGANAYSTCCDLDGDGCLEFSAPIECAGGATCTDGSCLADASAVEVRVRDIALQAGERLCLREFAPTDTEIEMVREGDDYVAHAMPVGVSSELEFVVLRRDGSCGSGEWTGDVYPSSYAVEVVAANSVELEGCGPRTENASWFSMHATVDAAGHVTDGSSTSLCPLITSDIDGLAFEASGVSLGTDEVACLSVKSPGVSAWELGPPSGGVVGADVVLRQPADIEFVFYVQRDSCFDGTWMRDLKPSGGYGISVGGTAIGMCGPSSENPEWQTQHARVDGVGNVDDSGVAVCW